MLSVALPSSSLGPAKLRGDGVDTHRPLLLEFWEQGGQPATSPAPVSERRAAPKSQEEATRSSIIATRSCIGLERGERGGWVVVHRQGKQLQGSRTQGSTSRAHLSGGVRPDRLQPLVLSAPKLPLRQLS